MFVALHPTLGRWGPVTDLLIAFVPGNAAANRLQVVGPDCADVVAIHPHPHLSMPISDVVHVRQRHFGGRAFVMRTQREMDVIGQNPHS